MGQAVTRKTYNLNGRMIRKVRRMLGVRTETEAIHRALRKVVDDAQVERALDRLLREGRFRTIYR